MGVWNIIGHLDCKQLLCSVGTTVPLSFSLQLLHGVHGVSGQSAVQPVRVGCRSANEDVRMGTAVLGMTVNQGTATLAFPVPEQVSISTFSLRSTKRKLL